MSDLPPQSAGGDMERVQELTWALLDEQINQDEMSLLDNLLLTGDKARATYIDCVQLHTDLAAHFDGQSQPADTNIMKSPVLGFLNAVMSPLGLQSPTAEDTSS